MFQWLTDWIRDRKIAADFEAAEQRAKRSRAREADEKFSATAMESDLREKITVLEGEADKRYGVAIARFEKAIAWESGAISKCRARLAILERDYKGELDQLYAELDKIKTGLGEFYEEKNQAHEDLQEARDSIDGWYGQSSRSCFGNGGRKLPQHSLFGQSFGDLESYKSDREEAYETITSCGNEINGLKRERGALYRQIQSVKQDRQEMYELRKRQGYTIPRVYQELSELSGGLGVNSARLRQSQADRAAFVEQERRKNGVEQLEHDIRLLREQREAFIQAFVEPAAVEERRRAHREYWLKRHQ